MRGACEAQQGRNPHEVRLPLLASCRYDDSVPVCALTLAW
jgi:hypothetical protein